MTKQIYPRAGAYVSTFFVEMYAPLVPLRPPPPSRGTLSVASSEASLRKRNLQLDHGQSPGSFTSPRFQGVLRRTMRPNAYERTESRVTSRKSRRVSKPETLRLLCCDSTRNSIRFSTGSPLRRAGLRRNEGSRKAVNAPNKESPYSCL
jgi:hypothetical protein